MHFTTLLPIALATLALASPIEPINLSTRAAAVSGIPGKSIVCGARLPREQTFTVTQIKTAAETAIDLLDANKQIGANKYPHRYGLADPEVKLAAACQKGDNLQEFPITRGKYTGGSVTDIPDRIVLKYTGKGKAVYCGLMTHEGAKPVAGVNAPFKSCSG
ncbi:hypothetical protein B0J11DRAFT_602249 [Dendryphion nanum]|uniref:ribonuclease T1 n=1 Tax=Dendryphion nanum TaxID=256645 RepID=A0A9P9E367_9PLEO|nr:hypothetical protein B0J11DRAFT_602249 [Dendryphion nanum]